MYSYELPGITALEGAPIDGRLFCARLRIMYIMSTLLNRSVAFLDVKKKVYLATLQPKAANGSNLSC